ncbi:MAG: aminotransferase class V-fold PLP-dependent enzyme, partial [Myxococcota bacterium]
MSGPAAHALRDDDAPPTSPEYDLHALRAEFPGLHQSVHGKPLRYLDNAASSQTPQQVIDALVRAYIVDRANIHRGVHLLSQRATEAFEATRESARDFLGAEDTREIVFVRGTTEALNLVATSLGAVALRPGDEILITGLEHHSNIVPWQLACERTGAVLKVVPIDERGEVRLDAYEQLLSARTRIVSLSHVSNALGTINPVQQMVAQAKATGAYVVVDGAQAVPHIPVDVRALGCDFYAFSAHKLYGPTGVGVLYGRREVLE